MRGSVSFCVFGGAVLLATPPVLARDLYVSMAGSDAADGSLATPWKTMGKAAQGVTAGDTVHVAPGRYQEVIFTSRSGTAAARIRYVSDTKWGAKIIPPAGTLSGDGMWNNSASYVDIEGFELDGKTNPYFRTGIDNAGGYARLFRNYVHHIFGTSPNATNGNGGSGINSRGSDYMDDRPNEVFENIVHDIGDFDHRFRPTHLQVIHGIYLSNPSGRLYNNITYRNEGYGLHLYHNPVNPVVANNLSFNNGYGGLEIGPGPLATNALVVNNIFYDNLRFGSDGSGGNNTFLNNIVYGNKTSNYNSISAGAHATDIAVDPKFVNYKADGTGDYHLAVGSPAIDEGVVQMAPSNDFDGVPRPQGREFDIGPYEWRPSADAGAPDAVRPADASTPIDERTGDASGPVDARSTVDVFAMGGRGGAGGGASGGGGAGGGHDGGPRADGSSGGDDAAEEAGSMPSIKRAGGGGCSLLGSSKPGGHATLLVIVAAGALRRRPGGRRRQGT